MTTTESPPVISTADSLSLLRLATANLDDLQHVRIAMKNRIAAAERDNIHNIGLNQAVADQLDGVEAYAKSLVEEAYRDVVSDGVIEWQESQGGVGPLQLGRLIGVIGHPRVAVPREYYDNPDFDEDEYPSAKNPKRLLNELPPEPRSVDQLRAYCGMGDPAMRHTKGMTADQALRCGNPKAKMLTYRIVVQCRMSAGKGYYAERIRQAKDYYSIVHPEWTPGHNDAAAIRRVGKYLLKDLYDAAADWPYVT